MGQLSKVLEGGALEGGVPCGAENPNEEIRHVRWPDPIAGTVGPDKRIVGAIRRVVRADVKKG